MLRTGCSVANALLNPLAHTRPTLTLSTTLRATFTIFILNVIFNYMTDLEIKKSISQKAIEYGVPTETSSLFDNLNEEFKRDFIGLIIDRDFGLPIVKYGHQNGNWVVIGTKEIAWKNEELNFLPIELIKGFNVPDSETEKAKIVQENRMYRKFEYEILTLHTFDGRTFDLWLAKKFDYYGFWHMIIRFMNWRKEDNKS